MGCARFKEERKESERFSDWNDLSVNQEGSGGSRDVGGKGRARLSRERHRSMIWEVVDLKAGGSNDISLP